MQIFRLFGGCILLILKGKILHKGGEKCSASALHLTGFVARMRDL